MEVIIKRRQTSLLLRDDRGMHFRLVFAEMDDDCARRLVREYGYKPEWVYGIRHEEVCYRHTVDDSLVLEAMERMPYRERYGMEDWLEAVRCIMEELGENEGILVASKVADKVGITRSVIVNALRKFESAGVIESRSSGMKGTYIKVLNDVVFDELNELKK